MAKAPKNIVQALAQEIDKKEADITLAKSLGKGNTTEVKSWEFQAEQWQEVLDNATGQTERKQ